MNNSIPKVVFIPLCMALDVGAGLAASKIANLNIVVVVLVVLAILPFIRILMDLRGASKLKSTHNRNVDRLGLASDSSLLIIDSYISKKLKPTPDLVLLESLLHDIVQNTEKYDGVVDDDSLRDCLSQLEEITGKKGSFTARWQAAKMIA